LTKWCDELWDKFENENYFLDRTEGLAVLKSKNISLVYPWLKRLLATKMKAEKAEILSFLKEIEHTNYSQQI
jgi:hypothetical protein